MEPAKKLPLHWFTQASLVRPRRKIRGNRMLRFADRYLGIPILSAAALIPKKEFNAATVKRIGLMKTVAIGDTVLLAGIITDVRQHYPHATIVLITGEDNRVAGQLMLEDGDEQVVISPHRLLKAIRSVREARLDVLVDFGAWPRFDALLSTLSGAAFRVGFKTAGEARHFGYDRTVEHSAAVHEIENFRRLLAPMGFVTTHSPPRICRPGVLDLSRLPRQPFIVFHPWAGGFMHEVKEWPTEKWVALAQRVHSGGRTVVLTGSPAEAEKSKALAAAIREQAAVVDAAGSLSLLELADMLAAADAVVSVNTGVMHLAAEVGARTVSLEGPTSAARWAPVGPRVRSVESTLPGSGYLNLGWEYAGQRLDCMNGVEVNAVMKAVEELMAGP